MNFRIIFLAMILAVTINPAYAEKTIAEETQKLAEDNGKPVKGDEKPKKVLKIHEIRIQVFLEISGWCRNSRK